MVLPLWTRFRGRTLLAGIRQVSTIKPPNPKEDQVPHASDLIGQKLPQDIPRDQINPVDEWQYKQIKQKPPTQRLVSTEGQVLDHELYTPPATPDQGLGPIVKPLHFPEYDQSVLSVQQTGHPSPPAWEYVEIENRLTEPIGDYPRFVPMQYAILKDPYVYWDQQNRRNFGEILYANDQMTNVWSPGPLPSWKKFFGIYAGFIALFSGLAYISTVYPTESDMAPKDFPFNGLNLDLGANPNDETDTWRRRRVYQDHFKDLE